MHGTSKRLAWEALTLLMVHPIGHKIYNHIDSHDNTLKISLGYYYDIRIYVVYPE